jgi:tol-pal system protein YbgF
LRDGHYSKAIAGFNSFLSSFPTGEYASNAQYWLGEAYKVSQNIPAARDAFNKVISNYPTSPKVPDALLKLGYLELEQNNTAKAKEYLAKVSASYPNTTAANLAAKKMAALTGGAPQ